MPDIFGQMLGNILSREAPPGEFPAFINPVEAEVLESMGGSGIMTPSGLPSYQFDPGSFSDVGFDGYSGSVDPDIGFDEVAALSQGFQNYPATVQAQQLEDLAQAQQLQDLAQALEPVTQESYFKTDGRPVYEPGAGSLAAYGPAKAQEVFEAGEGRNEGLFGLLPGRAVAEYDPFSGKVDEGYNFRSGDLLSLVLGGINPVLGMVSSKFMRDQEENPYFNVADERQPIFPQLNNNQTDISEENQIAELNIDPPINNNLLGSILLNNLIPLPRRTPGINDGFFTPSQAIQDRLEGVNNYGLEQLRRMGLA